MTYILTAIAILLAIPTFGVSLVGWIAIKYFYDLNNAKRIMQELISCCDSVSECDSFCKINNASIGLLYDIYGDGKLSRDFSNIKIGTAYSMTLIDPETEIKIYTTLTQLSNNTLSISGYCEGMRAKIRHQALNYWMQNQR